VSQHMHVQNRVVDASRRWRSSTRGAAATAKALTPTVALAADEDAAVHSAGDIDADDDAGAEVKVCAARRQRRAACMAARDAKRTRLRCMQRRSRHGGRQGGGGAERLPAEHHGRVRAHRAA
jgi:hypothetical protein